MLFGFFVKWILCNNSITTECFLSLLFGIKHGSQTLKIWILLSLIIEVLIDPQSDRIFWIQHPPLIKITPSMVEHVTQVISVQAIQKDFKDNKKRN